MRLKFPASFTNKGHTFLSHFNLPLTPTHTHRDTGSSCCVTHSQDGDVLDPVQPPNRCLGLADPLHHGHIMFSVKNIIIALVIWCSVRICTLSKKWIVIIEVWVFLVKCPQLEDLNDCVTRELSFLSVWHKVNFPASCFFQLYQMTLQENCCFHLVMSLLHSPFMAVQEMSLSKNIIYILKLDEHFTKVFFFFVVELSPV